MTGPDCDALAIKKVRQVMRVNSIDHKTQNCTFVSSIRSKDANPRNLAELLMSVLGQLMLVAGDPIESHGFNVFDRSSQSDRFDEGTSSRFELGRWIGPGR